jgi:hypothetical protein
MLAPRRDVEGRMHRVVLAIVRDRIGGDETPSSAGRG